MWYDSQLNALETESHQSTHHATNARIPLCSHRMRINSKSATSIYPSGARPTIQQPPAYAPFFITMRWGCSHAPRNRTAASRSSWRGLDCSQCVPVNVLLIRMIYTHPMRALRSRRTRHTDKYQENTIVHISLISLVRARAFNSGGCSAAASAEQPKGIVL